ncbi:hypothetical protein ACFSYH_06010 [Populibacterium corticicola]|uniref:Immunoglobulin domain-containing protein n=1 Tax=Populibacterium corticicola TaxID=1812826 RepID=A0ABW5XE62_9MICO
MKNPPRRFTAVAVAVSLAIAGALVTAPIAQAATSTGTVAKPAAKTKITAQPKSASAVPGKTAKFTVKASGQSLKYQWYSKKSGSKKWQKVSGSAAKKATYSVKATTKLNKTQYRVVVTGKQGKATSKAATLSLIAKPKITTQPKLASAYSGESVSFSVKASGIGLSYQWQVDNGTGWKNISGATKASYGFTAKSALELNTYRVVVKNPAGSVTSDAALLSVLSTVSDPMETEQFFWLWSWVGVLFDTWQEDDEYDSTYQDLWGELSITNISDYTLDAYDYLGIYYLGNDGEFYGDGGYEVTGDIWNTVPLAPGQSDAFKVYANVPDHAVGGGVWVFYDDTGEIIQYVEGF